MSKLFTTFNNRAKERYLISSHNFTKSITLLNVGSETVKARITENYFWFQVENVDLRYFIENEFIKNYISNGNCGHSFKNSQETKRDTFMNWSQKKNQRNIACLWNPLQTPRSLLRPVSKYSSGYWWLYKYLSRKNDLECMPRFLSWNGIDWYKKQNPAR